MTELLPCPFCGYVGVTCGETSTYRWGSASCDQCGASGPEIRKNTNGQDKPDWHEVAIEAWNRRAP